MKKSSRRRPELETLESMTLLTTIVPTTFTPVGLAAIQPGGPIQFASATKIQIVGLSSPITSNSSGLNTSTHRPVVVGLSVAPTIQGQAHHLVVINSGPIATASTKSPTVHAMIVPGSITAATSHTTHAVVVAGTPIKAATPLATARASQGLKLS